MSPAERFREQLKVCGKCVSAPLTQSKAGGHYWQFLWELGVTKMEILPKYCSRRRVLHRNRHNRRINPHQNCCERRARPLEMKLIPNKHRRSAAEKIEDRQREEDHCCGFKVTLCVSFQREECGRKLLRGQCAVDSTGALGG